MKSSVHQTLTLYVLSPALLLALIAIVSGTAFVIRELSAERPTVAGQSTSNGTYEQTMTKDGKTYKVIKTIRDGQITITTKVYDSEGNLIKEETKTKNQNEPTKTSQETKVTESKPAESETKVDKNNANTNTKNEESKDLPVKLEGKNPVSESEEPKLQGLGEVKRVQNEFQIGGTELTTKSNAPITVNETTGEVTVTTPTGEKELTKLPEEIIEKATKNKEITSILEVTLNVDENSNINYLVEGNKEYKIFGLVKYMVPVKRTYNAQNGETVSVKSMWLEGFLGF